MKQLLYRLIYNPGINRIERNIIKALFPFWDGKVKIPVSGKLRLKIGGTKLLVHTNQTSYASKQIYWRGIEEFEYVSLFKELIPTVDVFIDIGANTGIYSTIGGVLNPNLIVYGFEPGAGPFHYYKMNVEANRLTDRVFPSDVAISDQNGQATFHFVVNQKYTYLQHNLGGVGNLRRKISHRAMDDKNVQITTLDDFLKGKEVKGSMLIKIDTEATEDLVLAGMEATVQSHQPILICEVLYGKIESKIQSFARNNNYKLMWFDMNRKGLIPTETIERSEDNGYRDVFMVPENKISYLSSFILG